MSRRHIRVLIGKPGLDGHDRGAKVVATALRDRGMEVIYTGLHRTPEQIVDAVEQEDVHVLGLSILSGSHMALLPRVREVLCERGLDSVLLLAGGIIPEEDAQQLRESGWGMIFGPGTPTSDIADWIEQTLPSALQD